VAWPIDAFVVGMHTHDTEGDWGIRVHGSEPNIWMMV